MVDTTTRRTIHWNTSRLYAAEGQVITAQVHEDGRILFSDFSRHIAGYMAAPYPELIQTDADLRRYVMRLYDYHAYAYDAEANKLKYPTNQTVVKVKM